LEAQLALKVSRLDETEDTQNEAGEEAGKLRVFAGGSSVRRLG
jgi:hypothetical protein